MTTITLLITLFAVSSAAQAQDNMQSEGLAIELNEGKKWVVNKDMTPFIIEAESILKAYKGGDYKNLAKQLAEQNKGLINSCTMDGKSHDELHKWLHPHLQLVTALKNSKNEKEANAVIKDLNKSFEIYHTYFE